MSTVLLTLGRLPKALDLARAFHGAGWRVVVAEPFRKHLAGASNAVARSIVVTAPAEDREAYLRDLLRVVEEEAVDLVLPVSEEVVHVAALHGRLPARTRLFAMPAEAVLAAHDKGAFAAQSGAWGLPVPSTHPLGDETAALLAARQDVVVKPLHACSGRGVRVIRRGDPLPPADPAAPAIVQARIAGPERSTCSLVHAGVVSGTVVYQGLMQSGSVSIAFERVEDRLIEAFVRDYAAATGWTGFLSFDFMLDAEGKPWAIECNPRTTSGLHFFAPEDLARAVLDPAHPLRFRPEGRLQQFYSCLTETQLSLFRGGGFGRKLRTLATTRDVTWSARDPMPFLTMTATSWPIIREAMARRATFGEVATLDVGWRGAGA
ncbi:ATP-grasp domain-containing protein [Roseomonas sp. PWR1]|uniref:ATP-grasp domain-containing protein n=1 Tax=Roseomonas nitratireducens TaxID=2820810 RepID=A0ABS4AQ56_9PROT|nr:ATP-grasp domain-containing protein [Neoroseomonas nitratireducens]MBP0463364.1 ATP-grasp domain-containing protein [Neoroseomonas nitratireducens]